MTRRGGEWRRGLIPDMEKETAGNGANNFIEFVHVWKSFGDLLVLEDVSFEVRRGELLVILGKSGVGKSVTLKHIMGFLKPDEGKVMVDGEEISQMTEQALADVRRRVTMVFQSGALFDSLTAGENVAYALIERAQRGEVLSDSEIDARVEKMLGLVDLEDARDMMPADLGTGTKRAVAIARALAAKPEAILYDEPTTMVDPIMAHTIGDLMLKLKKHTGLTSVVVTHDMCLAQKLADRVVFLIEGRVGFFGTVQEMENSEEPLVREFLELDRVKVED